MKKRTVSVIILIIMLFSVNAFAEFVPFKNKSINAVFIGGENMQKGNVKDIICEYLGKEYGKSVDKRDFSQTNLTSEKAVSKLSEITSNKPDAVFIEIPGMGEDSRTIKQNTELLVRGILEKDRNTVIVFIVMPKTNGDNSAVLEIAKAYNTGIINFEEYVNRRIDAGVLKKSDILSGDILNEKGNDMLSDCVVNFYKTTPYKKAVYREISLTGKYNNETQQEIPDIPDNPAEDSGLSKEEAMSILENAAIVNVYKNTAMVKGTSVQVDIKNSQIKPASFGNGISYPIRFLRDYFSCKIKYNVKNGTITIIGSEKTVDVGFYQDTMVSDSEEITLVYPMVMYNNVTYIPQEVVSYVLGKTVISDDGVGVICDESLTEAQKFSVINYAKELVKEESR